MDSANSYAFWFDEETGATAIYPVYLQIRNPLVVAINSPADYSLDAHSLQGHDGVIATHADGAKEYVVFDPSQIKSAIGNSGAFDTANHDISR